MMHDTRLHSPRFMCRHRTARAAAVARRRMVVVVVIIISVSQDERLVTCVGDVRARAVGRARGDDIRRQVIRVVRYMLHIR